MTEPTLSDVLARRRSCRGFLPDPVEATTVREILAAASRAPSGGNLQPWKVIAVAGAEREAVSKLAMDALAANPAGEMGDRLVYPPSLWEPYRGRRFENGEALYATLGIPREDKTARFAHLARNYAFFDAPVGLFFVIDAKLGHSQWAHLGMFMMAVMLAAEARGLATCAQEAWAMTRRSLHAHFALEEEELLYCGMALGYPDPDHPTAKLVTTREPVEGFARFSGF